MGDFIYEHDELIAEHPIIERIGYSPSVAADLLSLSKSMLDTMRSKGEGPVYSKVGSRVVYQPHRLKEYLDSQEVTPSAPF